MTTGTEFKDWVLAIAGNIFIVILVIRALGHWAKREWGDIIVHIIAAVLIGSFIYATDETLKVIKAIGHVIFG